MDLKKSARILIFMVLFLVCFSGCSGQSSSSSFHSGSGPEGGSTNDKEGFTPKPLGGNKDGGASSGAAVSLSPAVSGGAVSGPAVSTEGAVGISQGGVDVSGGYATKEQKDSYIGHFNRTEMVYTAVTDSMKSREMDDITFEDYRYFEPIYEYYCGIALENCEFYSKEEMERIIKGIEEYQEELLNFARINGIVLPQAN